jgi:hypothetical protein
MGALSADERAAEGERKVHLQHALVVPGQKVSQSVIFFIHKMEIDAKVHLYLYPNGALSVLHFNF